jgi:hypothetical protein
MSSTLRSQKFEEYIETWINSKNKLIDPQALEPIEPSIHHNSKYARLYKMAFNYLLKTKKMSETSIQKMLPKHHIIFGNIDILYYWMFSKNKRDMYMSRDLASANSIYLCNFIYKNLGKHNDIDVENIPFFDDITKWNKNEKLVIYYLIYHYAGAIHKYIELASKMFNVSYLEFYKDVKTIKQQIDIDGIVHFCMNEYKLGDIFVTAFEKEDSYGAKLIQDMHSNVHLLFDYNLIIPHIVHNKMKNGNLYEYLKELLSIYDYQNHPYKSPFKNLANKQFKEIEDPLEVLIRDKIGVQNIDLKTLESPKRIFKNDAEYESYLNDYNTLQFEYERTYESWFNKNEHLKSKLPPGMSGTLQSTTPPKRPMLTLPNKEIVPILRKEQSVALPRSLASYIPDKTYNETKKTLAENKKTLDMYKDFINMNLLTLTDDKDTKKYEKGLFDKDRAYFQTNLFGNDDKKRDVHRCITNTDNLTSDNFDDQDYLLSKLQLMFRLHKRDENGNILFTYCFYAPVFYNYLVNQINAKNVIKHPITKIETIKNPITKEPVDEEDIHQLMNIMQMLKPSIERPIYIKPIHDIYLSMDHTKNTYKGHLFVDVFIKRNVGCVSIDVYKLCTILADVEVEESGSNDTTSEIFLDIVYNLFNIGRLLHTYMPPYKDENNEVVELMIHFNNYQNVEQWDKPTREDQLKMFIHYLDEIRRI